MLTVALAFAIGLSVGFVATYEWFCHMTLAQYRRYRALAHATQSEKLPAAGEESR